MLADRSMSAKPADPVATPAPTPAATDSKSAPAGTAPAAAAAKKKKKKKKPKSGAGGAASAAAGGSGSGGGSAGSEASAQAELASSFDDLSIHEFFRGTACKLAYSEKKGRHVVATRAIKAGEVVLETPPYAAVASDSFVEKVCHRCFKRPETESGGGGSGSGGSSPVLYVCAGCKHARFCSTACMNAFKAIHEMECKSLSKFEELEIEGDTTALRCVMRMLYLALAEKRYTEAKTKEKCM